MNAEKGNKNKITGTEKVYNYHHTLHRSRGQSVFKDIRGEFLREKIGKNKKVLDMGCRAGALTSTYCDGNNVLGLDIDNMALEIAKKNLGINVKHINLNSDWSIQNDCFDVVVAGEILEHLYYPEKIIQKVTNVLKSDGAMIGSVPNAFSLINRVRLFFGRKRNTPLCDPTHINHFSRKELKELLEKHFSVVNIYPLGRYAFLDKFFPGMFSFMLLFEAKRKKEYL